MRTRVVVALAVLLAFAAAATVAGARVDAALPLCPTHDPTAWHGLVDSERRCHYDHEHKDDPHAVDDVLGPPGAWFAGNEISYPWQTFKGAGERWPRRPADPGLLENSLKHSGYGYGVRRGMSCRPAFDADGCLTDIRMQVHALATAHDATTRFHSFSLEARGCIRGRCGIVREGGWIDYGELRLDTGKPYAIEHLPLPGDPVGQDQLNPQRIHKTPPNEQRDATWYSQPGRWNRHLSNLGLRFEMWGPVDPRDPGRALSYCRVDGRGKPRPDCTANGSWLETHLVPIRVPAELDGRDGKRDGLVTFRGYTDRYGNLRSGCRRAGLDCVPLQLERMPVGYYQYRDDVQGVTAADHDVTPRGSSWLCFPGGGAAAARP
jgi:hypothetical protein